MDRYDPYTDKFIRDTISRQAAIETVMDCYDNAELFEVYEEKLRKLPSAQPEQLGANLAEVGTDCISRQALLDKFEPWLKVKDYNDGELNMLKAVLYEIRFIPSAQPQRTCVNCGRTANNGGWYADGRTRCPIEEHYALPKDGYCHLWEKRNVTDDDYPERREE